MKQSLCGLFSSEAFQFLLQPFRCGLRLPSKASGHIGAATQHTTAGCLFDKIFGLGDAVTIKVVFTGQVALRFFR